MNAHPALWGLGFRPFFLLASGWAAATLLIWVTAYALGWQVPLQIDPLNWHAHEMVYGFGVGIIVGFLLTATQNWTGIRGVNGGRLQLVVAIWCIGRLGFFLVFLPAWCGPLMDLAFVPVALWSLWPYLARRNQRRNHVFLLHFVLMFAGNLMFHGWFPGTDLTRRGLLMGLMVEILILVLIGGRVIPFFTSRAVEAARVTRHPNLEWASHGSAWLLGIVWVIDERHMLMPWVALVAMLVHAARLALWHPFQSRRIPILWILHLGYAWLVLAFGLTALAGWGLIARPLALHALTVGPLSVLIYGMVSRVSLGHTGRVIRASPLMTVGYVLVNAAFLLRVFMPIVRPSEYRLAVILSGSAWAVAFVLLVAALLPILTSPRPDGKPG